MKNNLPLQIFLIIMLFFSFVASAAEIQLHAEEEIQGYEEELIWEQENSYFWDFDLQQERHFSPVNFRSEYEIEDFIFKNIMCTMLRRFNDTNSNDIKAMLLRAVNFRNRFFRLINYQNLLRELTVHLRNAGVYDYDLLKIFLTNYSRIRDKKPEAKCPSVDAFQAYAILRYYPITYETSREELGKAMCL